MAFKVRPTKCLHLIYCLLGVLFSTVSAAENIIEASSLFTCMDDSLISANYFQVAFTPHNRTISYDVSITSEITGYIKAEVEIYAYGIKIITETIDPCKEDIGGFCPLVPGALEVQSNSRVSEEIVSKIPGVTYTVPDIDVSAVIRIIDMNSTLLACIQADLTNQRTVEHISIKWVTAITSGIGLITSAITATLGFSGSSAHVAATAASLFTYYQSVVIITMCAVDRVPPIASAWAQNLAWSVGIIRINFMQKLFRWYIQATGGTPHINLLHPTISVLVQRRNCKSPDQIEHLTHHDRDLLHSFLQGLVKRSATGFASSPHTSGILLVMRGILRVAYKAGIETTSVVLTAFTFFVLVCLAIATCFASFYGIVRSLQKCRVIPMDSFCYFNAHWKLMMKGTLLKILFISSPSLFVFAFWEFIKHDSAAVIVLAVFFLLLSMGILGWSIYKIYFIGKESTLKYGTPALLLFSNTKTLNRYGCLYIPLKASSYRFLICIFAYTFVKACIVSFAQESGKTQAVALFAIELVYFVMLCYRKPYLDKKTNALSISIGAVMLANTLCFLFFSEVFHQPRAVGSILGVVFFVLNAAFSLFLMLFSLYTCTKVLLSKNPDSRYQPPRDDRVSFIPDQKRDPSHVAELTALGATARADHKIPLPTELESSSRDIIADFNRSKTCVSFNAPYSSKKDKDVYIFTREVARSQVSTL